jgi:NAD(P)-dependent dehydrogenase (short-subunit alcohol dehydrogenase family)
MSLLTGKRAFITGASRGIGAAIARRLAAEGADIAVTYARSAELAQALTSGIEEQGRRAIAIRADSGDARALKSAIDQAAHSLGGLDILINNAGILKGGGLEEMTPEDIDATLAVNVRSVIIACQAAAAHMGEGGRIISIGSCLATHVGSPGLSLYSLSKAALIGWTQGLARDLGPRGITVNVIHPGPTDTDMNPAQGAHSDGLRARMALGHYGEPEDIAGLVAFVAGPEGRFITGAGLTIDGGMNA